MFLESTVLGIQNVFVILDAVREQVEANLVGLNADVTDLVGQLEALRSDATTAAANDPDVEQALAGADATFAVLDGVVAATTADFESLLALVDREEAVTTAAATTINELLPADGVSDKEVVAAAVAVDALIPIDVDLDVLFGRLNDSNILINDLIIAFDEAEAALQALEAALA